MCSTAILPAVILCLATLALLPACNDKPTGPPPPTVPTAPDTTTHDWRFEIDTLGDRNSFANKIVAFGPSDAWVCGKFLEYTNPNDPWDSKEYNVAHWDGKTWALQEACTPMHDGYALFGLNKDYVLLAAYGLCWHYGTSWRSISIPEGTFNGLYGIWGKNEGEFHIVGHKGTWTIWDGQDPFGRFTKIPTPTTVDLTDIYGDGDVIYACGTNFPNDRSALLRFQNGKVELIDSVRGSNDPRIESIWYSKQEDVLAVCGSWQRFQHNGWHTADSNWLSLPWCNYVRGSGLNNIWWVGQRMYLLHYNGNSWRHWRNYFANEGELTGVAVGKDYLFACGVQFIAGGSYRGIVIRGYPMK